MSFNSNNLNGTLESMDNSFPISQTSSPTQSQQIFIQPSTGIPTVVRNQHLTLAQMRGVRQVWNYSFPKTKKRMNKDEKNRRWNSYKARIYNEYGRIITGSFFFFFCDKLGVHFSFLCNLQKKANGLLRGH